jgi:3-oxoadipate enol-lactonase
MWPSDSRPAPRGVWERERTAAINGIGGNVSEKMYDDSTGNKLPGHLCLGRFKNMPKAVLNGVEIYYEEQGSGPALILLHGLTSNLSMFATEIEYLQRQFRVIALDARGHGKSGKPARYTLEDHVNDVLALMDFLHLERASILGISMGSYIAQGIAVAAPERVDKLILVSAKPEGETSSMMRLFAEHADELAGLDYMEKITYLSKYIFHNFSAVTGVMNEDPEQSPILTADQQTAANQALAGFDFRSQLSQITAKTLIISGAYDGLTPPAQGRDIASRIAGSIFVEFPDSGHAPNFEEADKFKKTITDFLLR